MGISEEDQKKLFKLFGFLTHNQKMNTKGVGLGLVIAKMITEKFDGEITLDSTVGVGSTFTFRFKLDPILDDLEAKRLKKKGSGNMLNSNDLVFKWQPQILTYKVRYYAFDDGDEQSEIMDESENPLKSIVESSL